MTNEAFFAHLITWAVSKLGMADSLGYEWTLSKQSTGEADSASAAPTAWAAVDAAVAAPAALFSEVKGWLSELTEDKKLTMVNDAVKDAPLLAPAQFKLRSQAFIDKDGVKYDEFCAKYWVTDWRIIRPCGNSLTPPSTSFKTTFMSDDFKYIFSDLVAINSTKVSHVASPLQCLC